MINKLYWQIKPLGEVCKIVSGNTPKGIEKISNSGTYHFYKVSDMNSSGNEVKMTRSNYNLSYEEIVKLKLKLYPKGTVIFPKRGGAILTNKKRVLSKDSTFDLNLMGVLPNENVNSSFLFYWFVNLDLGKICDGSNIPQINNKNIVPLDFPLPPIETQQAIVSKIEELFSELDKGIEDLKTAQQQLKTYRQSVLKWAFEGKLTNENVKEGELPKGWKIAEINTVSSINPKLPNKENLDREMDVQFLPMKLVEEIINKIHLSEVKKLHEVLKGSYTPFIDNDILFAKVTPCMENGKIAIVEKLRNGIGFGSSEFHVVRVSEKVSNKFMFYFLVQDRFRNEAANAMTGAVGLRRVPKQFIENYPIPIPSLDEQYQIVQEIESRLSVADKMEESIAQSLQQAEALRQSILKMAFSGELV